MNDVWNNGYERPIRARYLDPVDVVWFATARRLRLTIRRDPAIFSSTDGAGLLTLGPPSTLDPDDSAAQMIFHEICHWIINGVGAWGQRDWGFALDAELDWREHACLRLQASLADAYGLRGVLAPTSQFREYFDKIGPDPFVPFDSSEREQRVCARAREARAEAQGDPWGACVPTALAATAQLRDTVQAFLPDYASDLDGDALPSLWGR